MSTHPPTVLERILAETRAELERRKQVVPPQTLLEHALLEHGSPERTQGLRDALRGPGVGVIAEFKRRSPSAGRLREDADAVQVAGAYERGGAVALSVLTEGPNFDGSLEDLRSVRAVSGLPILRKDFIVDPYQLYEARAAGADAVLLITAALPPDQLGSLHERARELGLDALVEVHDASELRTALDVQAELIGINNRDLKDFSVDVGRTARLMEGMPSGVTVVSESGIATAEQVQALGRAGVHAVLVGESLMRSRDPESQLRTLRALAGPGSGSEEPGDGL